MVDQTIPPSLPDQIVSAMLAKLEDREEFDFPTIETLGQLANSGGLRKPERILAVLRSGEDGEP